jgi:hypothetical protein
MDPGSDHFFRVLELSGLSNQKPVKYIRNMSNVEFVMEVNSGFSESLSDASV